MSLPTPNLFLVSFAAVVAACLIACGSPREAIRDAPAPAAADTSWIGADPDTMDAGDALLYAHALLYSRRYDEAARWFERAYIEADSIWRVPPPPDSTSGLALMARQVSAQTHVRLAWLVRGREGALDALRRLDRPTRVARSMGLTACFALHSDSDGRLPAYAQVFMREGPDLDARVEAALGSCMRSWPEAVALSEEMGER